VDADSLGSALWLRRVATAEWAVALGSTLFVVTDVLFSPDLLGLGVAGLIGLGFFGFGVVAGGWKAAQLAVGRGRAALDLWTLTWLCTFAAWGMLPWLQLAR
jgi:hypothetical protein